MRIVNLMKKHEHVCDQGYLHTSYCDHSHDAKDRKESDCMKKIALFGKYGTGYYALVDDQDYEELNKHKWFLAKDYKTEGLFYVNRPVSNKKKVFLHREILGDREGFFVDHINRNTLDNRRENLRHLNPSDSAFNRRMFGKGSCKRRNVKGYTSQVYVSGYALYLGIFKTEEEAKNCYKSSKNLLERLKLKGFKIVR